MEGANLMSDYLSDININDYLYMESFTLTNSMSQDISDYPVRLELTSSNFNFDLSNEYKKYFL